MKLKALLVTSPNSKKNKFWTCSITSPVGSLMPPCDLVSIAAVLRNNDIEPKILDLRLGSAPLKLYEHELEAWRPDAIITNMATATALDDYPLLHIARDTVARRIVFNFHAMALPDEMFAQGATHILVGDPEYAAAAAVKGCDGNNKGVWTKGLTASEPGWVEPLDQLPYPALDLIDIHAYHTLIMGKEPFSILLANRGCFYLCPYCVIPYLFGKKVRSFSVPRIIGEIERDMREFNIKAFFFIDSAINLNPQWAHEFCEEVLKRNLKIRWCSNMRVPGVSGPLLALMKKSGCFRLFYGVEDLDLLQEMKQKATSETIQEAFRLTREAGIETVAFIMLFPGIDTSEKAMADRIVKGVLELKADALQCNFAIPYPGTALYTQYTQRYAMSKDWSLYDPAGNAVPYPAELDLAKVRRKVYLRFFMKNPTYLWRILKDTDVRSIMSFLSNSSKVLFAKD